MSPARYYFSIFLRRFPYFLIVATIVSAVSITVAMTLPPTYVSQMRLIVESPQIPGNLAASTVTTTPFEQLQIVEQRLLTRPVLLDIAHKFEVLPDATPDQMVEELRAKTRSHISAGRGQASLMTFTYEARSGKIAAAVLNEYLTEILKLDVSYRKERASDTLEFFEQEVDRLGKELDKRSTRILEFQNENSDALPASLQFRMAQQGALQTSLQQTDQQIFALQNQREKLVELYNTTGQVTTVGQPQTQTQLQLSQLRNQLDNQLAVYSENSPRIRILRARIARLEEAVAVEQATNAAPSNPQTGNSTLDLQLAQLDSQIAALEDQRVVAEENLKKVTLTIDQTPANAITLAELQRDHDNIQTQYNTAVARLASASTGERIEVTSQGQRISVIEHPTEPTTPTKPDRLTIAAGGTFAGISLGLGLVVLLELLNRAARRPEDLINKLDVWPIATIPYVRSPGEVATQRLVWAAIILVILIGVPAGVWAVHTYYLPLDLIAEKVIDKLEVYW